MKKFLMIFLISLIAFYGCNKEEREKANSVGRLSFYMKNFENGVLSEKIKEAYPDLQIGLIYYDKLDDTYKAVDPRKGFEKLGYSESYNKEVYDYVMYKMTKDAINLKNKQVEEELIKTLKDFQKLIEEERKNELLNQKIILTVLKIVPYGLLIFFTLVGSGIFYLLYSIAKKHEIL